MSRYRRGWIILPLLLATILRPAGADGPHRVTLTVSGGDPGVGRMMVSLFNSQQTWMKAPQAERSKEVDADGNARLVFDGLEPGDYAIAVIYDKNANGKLDTGLFRIPKEKIGFSNNARGHFGPAKWSAAKFTLDDAGLDVAVQLQTAEKD